MNHVFLLLHRWGAVFIAGFLVMSGLTGAVISWDHELDELLNPHLTRVQSQGPPLPVLNLVRAIVTRVGGIAIVAAIAPDAEARAAAPDDCALSRGSCPLSVGHLHPARSEKALCQSAV
jgi:uncharacterized iron-regulated membrane protein